MPKGICMECKMPLSNSEAIGYHYYCADIAFEREDAEQKECKNQTNNMIDQKEKAEELVGKFYEFMPFRDCKLTSCIESEDLIIDMEKLSAIQCAIIAVDEIIKENYKHGTQLSLDRQEYWLSVKEEILKLK
jgi:hypothetical protein